MINKQFLFTIFFILFASNIFAVKCGETIVEKGSSRYISDYCYINSGERYSLYTLEKCEGTITAKVRVKFNSDTYYLSNFIKDENNIWTLECTGEEQKIIFVTDKSTSDEFDIVLEYYNNLKTEGDKTEIENYNENQKMVKSFNNIRVNYNENVTTVHEVFNLKNIGNGIYVLTSVIIIFVIVIVLLFIYGIKYILNDKTNKITGEKKYTKTLDEELDSIIKDL